MTTQNINLIPSEPKLKDLLNYFGRSLSLDLNCHHVGTITSFNSVFQTAQATINYTKTFLKLNSIGQTTIQTPNYPQLIDCPVICLGGGQGCLTFPIEEGDECLVLFNDRDFDNWFNGSSGSAPLTSRTHAFTDAIILVGLRSLSNVIVGYDEDAVALRYGQNAVKIFEDEAVINVGLNEVSVSSDAIQAKVGSSITLEINAEGQLSITNLTGEFVAALIQALTTGSAGGFPFIIDPTALATLQSFQA